MSDSNDKQQNSEEFIRLMTDHQGPLYCFVFSLLADATAANDVLQETNLTLWKKADDFQFGSSFKSWSFRVASFQVMSYRKRQKRDRLVFNDDLVIALTNELQNQCEHYQREKELLKECLEKLNERQKELVDKRYKQGHPVKNIASALKESANSIAQALHRARHTLIKCVQKSEQSR